MESIEEIAVYILETAKQIFKLNVELNLPAIFQGKTFIINAGDVVKVEEAECKDAKYYFEHPKLDGIIINKENSEKFCIKATVQYINSDGDERGFAKIRIYDYDGSVRIKGLRCGSWEDEDFKDVDFFTNPDPELNLVLESMKNSISAMYQELNQNISNNHDLYNPEWVKKLKPYNN